MPKRKIITIDEDLCNGCGNCVTGCAEGALQIVNGKAKLVKEEFCDGFGDCIGACPTGALKIEERETEEFDIGAVKRNLMQTQGVEAVRRMESANMAHERGEHPVAHGGGCPGTRMRETLKGGSGEKNATPAGGLPERINVPELNQWPVQLHLVQPGAPFFKNKEMVVLSTCSPIASADVHWRFIRGRSVVVACPKLDDTEGYVEKMAGILAESSISKIIVVRMEVPCCGGLTMMVREAVKLSCRTDLALEEVIVSLDGRVIAQKII